MAGAAERVRAEVEGDGVVGLEGVGVETAVMGDGGIF